MEPIATIVTALVAAAVASAKDVVGQAVKDAYAGLKALILRKFGDKADVARALEQVEKKLDSDARRAVLAEELKEAGAGQDAELVKQAQALLDLLKQQGLSPGTTYTATLTGSGAIAQDHSAAAGAGGIAIGGNVQGDVSTGKQEADDK